MVGKIVCSSSEVSDTESYYELPKKGSKDDPIILSDSEEVELKGNPKDMDFEMSYARVNKKNYQDSDGDEDEDPKTPLHYHSDEFHDDSSNEQ
ncbi:hypothetical protein FNV43_RR08897 [Rhamnella rubrinervis]|uniref:Uncharacterized protein n=1 Tax=Rhamnella rubrinervis TaxID=2594499 RepID=A0A8K0HA51_9ROSA|nr:hypothetical protein FNV43_RR08897 [Rhamnella rubrinervis]